jgi:hypothetical protein
MVLKPCRKNLVRNLQKFGDNRCRKPNTIITRQKLKKQMPDLYERYRPAMHEDEIIKQFPRFSAAAWKALVGSNEEHLDPTVMYGKAATKLTRTLAKKLVLKPLFMIWGQNWSYKKKPEDRASELTPLVIVDPDVDDMHDHMVAHVVSNGHVEKYVDYIYYDGEDAVTGSGADPIYVFIQ